MVHVIFPEINKYESKWNFVSHNVEESIIHPAEAALIAIYTHPDINLYTCSHQYLQFITGSWCGSRWTCRGIQTNKTQVSMKLGLFI